MDVCSYPMENPAAFWNEQMKFLSPSGAYFIDANDRHSLLSNMEPFDSEKLFYYQSHKKDLMELFDSLADGKTRARRKKIIQADRPVIAVCVYHFKEDIFYAVPVERSYRS